MTNVTQKEFVLKELKEKGFVTRNWALRNYISRLGSIILMLKNEGYEIKGKNFKIITSRFFFFKRHRPDYKYYLTK